MPSSLRSFLSSWKLWLYTSCLPGQRTMWKIKDRFTELDYQYAIQGPIPKDAKKLKYRVINKGAPALINNGTH